jgi:hypothetical protein
MQDPRFSIAKERKKERILRKENKLNARYTQI